MQLAGVSDWTGAASPSGPGCQAPVSTCIGSQLSSSRCPWKHGETSKKLGFLVNVILTHMYPSFPTHVLCLKGPKSVTMEVGLLPRGLL